MTFGPLIEWLPHICIAGASIAWHALFGFVLADAFNTGKATPCP